MKKELKVKLCPHSNIDLSSVFDELEYGHYELEDPSADLPLKFFEAQPVASKKIVAVHVQVESEDVMSLLISGNTWNFRTKLDEHGIPGSFFNETGDDGKEIRNYYRVMRGIDVSDEDQKARVTTLFREVLGELAVKVVLDNEIEEAGAVADFIDELKALPYLHFA